MEACFPLPRQQTSLVTGVAASHALVKAGRCSMDLACACWPQQGCTDAMQLRLVLQGAPGAGAHPDLVEADVVHGYACSLHASHIHGCRVLHPHWQALQAAQPQATLSRRRQCAYAV